MNEYVAEMKRKLRITTDKFDDDIEGYIFAGLVDMNRAGVTGASDGEESLSNRLVRVCVEFYLKWLMNFEGDGSKYKDMYEGLRDTLGSSQEESYEDKQQETDGA